MNDFIIFGVMSEKLMAVKYFQIQVIKLLFFMVGFLLYWIIHFCLFSQVTFVKCINFIKV